MERRGFLGMVAAVGAALGLTKAPKALAAVAPKAAIPVSDHRVRALVYWVRDVPDGIGPTEHSFSFVDMIHLARQVASTAECQYPRPIGVMLGRNVYPIAARLSRFELTADPSDIYFGDPPLYDGRRTVNTAQMKIGTLSVHTKWDVFVDLDCPPDRLRVTFERKCGSLGGFNEIVTVDGVILTRAEAARMTGVDNPPSYGWIPA